MARRRSMATRTRGGVRETEVRLFTVIPIGRPSAARVATTATPVANWLMRRRTASGSGSTDRSLPSPTRWDRQDGRARGRSVQVGWGPAQVAGAVPGANRTFASAADPEATLGGRPQPARRCDGVHWQRWIAAEPPAGPASAGEAPD